jgi:site-specific recombinase XerD
MGPHVTRTAGATNAPDNGADIAKVQEWLGIRQYLGSKLLRSFWKG